MAIKRINGGKLFRNIYGTEEVTVSEFLLDGDSEVANLPVDESVAVGSQAMKLTEAGETKVYIFGPSKVWYPYNGVSFLE